MLAPLTSASVVATVKAKAEAVNMQLAPGKAYELVATVDAWVRQRRDNEEGDATAGKDGSMLVFKGRVVTLSGYHGSVLSVVRDKADGIAVITPLAEV